MLSLRPVIRRLSILFVIVVSSLCAGQSKQLDRSASSITVAVAKSGVFSGFAHDHTVVAPIASGSIDTAKKSIQLTFHAQEMKVTDKEGSDSDRAEIEKTMKSDKVLDVASFPEISFASTGVDPSGEGAFNVRGDLSLHGKTRPIQFPVMFKDGRYSGSVKLKQTDFGITPIRIAGGTVKVKDEIQVSFIIVSLD
jgi:polyisoprenoid-binding protein YceI